MMTTDDDIRAILKEPTQKSQIIEQIIKKGGTYYPMLFRNRKTHPITLRYEDTSMGNLCFTGFNPPHKYLPPLIYGYIHSITIDLSQYNIPPSFGVNMDLTVVFTEEEIENIMVMMSL